MSVDPRGDNEFGRLADLPVKMISPNPRNPRLVFPEEELSQLADSIDVEGILVPIVVYEKDDGYILIDGERRYRCARTLGISHIPALIRQEQNEIGHLIEMFNIHHMRERWRDIPTARALDKLADALSQDLGRTPTIKELSSKTALSLERIKRLRFAMELPADYQQHILDGKIPLNWFWELDRNVIKPLASRRKNIFDDFGVDGISRAFVKKRLARVITDTVSLRNVRPIIEFAYRDAQESPSRPSLLDDTIRGLIEDDELTIATAYQDSVQIMVETDKLRRSTANMMKGFGRLLAHTRNDEERQQVLDIALALRNDLSQLIDEYCE